MTFPIVFHILGLSVPAHLVFEMLAYTAGFRLYLWLKARQDTLGDGARLTVLAGAIAGAGLGSKLLGLAEHPELWGPGMGNPAYLLSAGTILGALLGGTLGVEIAKLVVGIRRSTGDLYVFPLLVAILIGRIGCLLTGVADGTWGDATQAPWGFDAGDGILRHPTPLYEIGFLSILSLILLALRGMPMKEGDRFRIFLLAYCAWRFGVEFIKPVTTYAFQGLNVVQYGATTHELKSGPGLSVLQMAALAGVVVYGGYFLIRLIKGAAWRRGTTSSSN